MADIRINSLPTTASASSSDDFLALDGATNGTRKLNAYSPTFGGNLTVSGTTGSTFGQIARTNGTNATVLTLSDNLTGVSTAGFGLQIRGTSNNGGCVSAIGFENGGTGTNNETQFSVYTQNAANALTKQFTIGSTGNATLSGNLTVSGTGTNSFSGPIAISASGTDAAGFRAITTSSAQTGYVRVGADTASAVYDIGVGGSAHSLTAIRDKLYTYANGAVRSTMDTSGNLVLTTGNLTVSGGTITGGTSGMSLASGGTNQNITLTPSGTGATILAGSNSAATFGGSTAVSIIRNTNSTAGAFNTLFFVNKDNFGSAIIATKQTNNGNNGDNLHFVTKQNPGASWNTGMVLTTNDNLLIGTTTDSGNGKLQLATHTTSAGGIGFGTDTSLYRRAIGYLVLDRTGGGQAGLDIADAGVVGFRVENISGAAYLSTQTAASIFLRTNNTTALTLDSSQNATFAGNYVYVGGGTSFYLRATGSGNGLWYGNNISADIAGSFSFRNQAGTVTNASIDSSGNATFAGKTYTAAGAAATPAISFSGDTDTGFYNAGGNQMALACGGGQIWNTTVNGLSMASGKDIYLGNAYQAGAPTATGYLTIKDSNGTAYKIPVVAV